MEPTFQSLPDHFIVGETYQLEAVSLHLDGELRIAEFTIEGDSSEKVENVDTVLIDNGKRYKTTGEFTPRKKGKYTLSFKIAEEDVGHSYLVDTVTAKMKVINEGDIFVPGQPEQVEAKLSTSTSVYEVGKKIKFTVATPKKGSIYEDARFEWMYGPDKTTKVEDIQTVKKGSNYITTGYFTPKQEGEYKLHFSLVLNEDDRKLWEGTADKVIKVKRVAPKSVKVGILSLENHPSIQAGGQAVLIAKIPKYDAKQGYRVEWSDNVTPVAGSRSSDNSYTYEVGLFKAETAGVYDVSFKAYRENQWVGMTNMKVIVDE
ncbi:hypothetical protein [Brevibacillus nitrificans]|uniref:hypothetical protein n=1 Tax=Brevibacillus nitrificans TaxID=651560 RepID=UPI00262A71B6|nr:hypothetical protein [Brevibacillus nitrificans]MED1793093.1 hypothetical protein [Brevibacillus nitrificans]